MGIAIYGRKLGEDEAPAGIGGPKQVAGDGVVGRLMPERKVSHRSPELALQTGRVAMGGKSPGNWGEYAGALRHQLKYGPHIRSYIAVE
jgi:hypothetical protein